MAVQTGFFNSINNDRRYQANDMNKPYELLVSNGVFATPAGTPSNFLQVYANDSMGVTVRPGRGIFFDKWLINDSDLYLPLDPSEVTLKRIDSVVVRVDINETVRAGTIYLKKGTPGSSPTAPALERTDLVKEYRLANITINPGVSSITQSAISDRRGYADECGWVTSLVQQVDTSTLFAQFDTGFNEWFSSIKEFLATATLIRSYTSAYTTTVQDETVIPINITQFNKDLDILQVYINGLMLIKDYEYSSYNNENIVLTHGVDPGTTVSFVVYKSIDGSNAETVVGMVEELFGRVEGLESLRITAPDGTPKLDITDNSKNVLTEFINLGVGFHTIYAATGVQDLPPTSGGYRCIGHVHTVNTAWLMAIHTNGSVYVNFYFEAEWVGWRALYEHAPAPLWTGTSFLAEDVTVTPSKPLNQCAHGWQLVFSDYDDDTSTANSSDICSVMIPKKNLTGANWGGSSFLCLLPTTIGATGAYTATVKRIYVYNDRFTGYTENNAGDVQRDVVLRAVYEY